MDHQQKNPIGGVQDNMALKLLYETCGGRALLKVLTRTSVSGMLGRFMDSSASKLLIPGFIWHYGIDMREYRQESYGSFNAFFTRRIRPEMRPVDSEATHLIAPCDGLLSVYRLCRDTALPIKHSVYTAGELLQDEALAASFENGFCLVFRLKPENYHRYCFPDDGIAGAEHSIPGALHTVRPLAMKHYRVFTENARTYRVLDTKGFGRLIQMEVGALLVGRIENDPIQGPVRRGQEKGRFLYGGSTILLLVKDGILDLEECHREVPVRQGQQIAQRAKAPED